MATKGSLDNPEGAHLSESVFRKYEDVLKAIVENYPSPFIFTPTTLQATTVVVWLRNAANAILTHGYATTLDIERLREIWKKVRVMNQGSKVVVATREEQQAAKIQIAREAFNEPRLLTINNPSIRVLDGLCILILEGALTNPTLLTGTIPDYAIPPGVVLEINPDGTHTIL